MYGFIVYSTKFLPKADTVKKPIYYSNPSVILTPLFGEPCSVTGKSIATCIEWHKNGEQIAAGFGNGTICIWMLKPSANIMASYVDKCLTVQPYMIFQAGGTPVTSISFAPLKECRWLVSSSLDKTLKFFDLHDPCMPFCSLKRGVARNCEWAKKFCGAYVSLQDGVNCKGTCLAKECGTEEIATQNISNSINCLTFSAISEVINAQAIVDMTGTVTVNLMRNSYEQLKLPCYKNFIIFKTEVMALTENKEIIDPEVSNPCCSVQNLQKQVDKHEQDVADVMKDLLNCVSVHNFNTKSMLSLENFCREQKIDEKGISLSCVPPDNSFQNYLPAEKKIFKEIKTLLNSVVCCVNNLVPTISTSKNPIKSAYDADLNSSVKENSSNKHSVESKQHLVESDTKNCISNDENNLKPVNPPKKLKTSDVNLNVSKTDSEFQENLNSSSKESSIVVKPVPTLESECPKESKKPQFICQTTLLPRSCRPFIQVYNSTKETKKLENLNSQNKNTEHLHENMDKSDNNDIEDILIESPSYATLAKTYGLIFKDNSPEILSSEEKRDSLPIENTTLSALNTVCYFLFFCIQHK
ncbi:hypothetical protein CEXT_355231 [Caerostris extrusa]|uniref:Uncharacterized protein n=1 Tax=Caerostris extrusa TaxID=172846 RepID=A0AAV4QD11_CAEEX|nr:hypothetical protein CEXT_355231 [Caerostris extrusa]